MAIDLSFLEDAPAPAAPAAAPAPAPAAPVADSQAAARYGKAVEFDLSEIDEDENQPRREYDQTKLEELAASIKASGVIQPISIKRNPDKPGRWIINYGHRRFRASLLAGKKVIPAIVSDAIDDYGQVIENLQRDDLTPIEIAAFIEKRIAAGDSKKEIAKRLGKPNDFISIHLALIDMPVPVAEAYAAGKFNSPRYVYDFRALLDKNQERAEAWLLEQTEITRRAIDELAEEIKGRGKKAKPAPAASAGEGGNGANPGGSDFVRTKSGGGDEGGEGGAGEGGTPPKHNTEKLPPAPNQDGAGDGTPTKSKQSDPNAISRPLLIVEFDGRAAAVLLNRRPSTAGLVWIKYEDGGGEEEIDAGQCKINRLMDGSP